MKHFMRKYTLLYMMASAAALFMASCGEDRSHEYYELINPKIWLYDTMEENYLFYDELPDRESLESNKSFFKKPDEFVHAVASRKDQKNGVYFSHVDSVFTSRTKSEIPSFGFEGVVVRDGNTSKYYIQILYVQKASPAAEVGLQRGDCITEANGYKITSSNYSRFIFQPTQAYTYKVARHNESTQMADTLMVDMPAPTYVDEPSVYLTKTINVGSKKVFYLMYNAFEAEETESLQQALTQGLAESPDDVILDLRYNPGGSVATAITLNTFLAPASAMNQTCAKLIFNDKIKEDATYKFDPSLLNGAQNASFNHLYVLTTSNTASASELVINCLRPYLGEKLLQVGENTFGKNVAQSKITNEAYPLIEFWLTTAYVSNAEGNYDYYTNGLQADYKISENYGYPLGELGTASDPLTAAALYHIANGAFPKTETEGETTPESRSSKHNTVRFNSIAAKPKLTKIQ